MEVSKCLDVEDILKLMDSNITDSNIISIGYADDGLAIKYYYVDKNNFVLGEQTIKELVDGFVDDYLIFGGKIKSKELEKVLDLVQNSQSIERYINYNTLMDEMLKRIEVEDMTICVDNNTFFLSTEEDLHFVKSKIEDNLKIVLAEKYP